MSQSQRGDTPSVPDCDFLSLFGARAARHPAASATVAASAELKWHSRPGIKLRHQQAKILQSEGSLGSFIKISDVRM